MSGIFLVGHDGDLVQMTEAPYESEAKLQEYLAAHPILLSGDQAVSGNGGWLLVSRECSIPCEADGSARWSVDHLFLDQRGVPTLVEVKRSTDTRIRREVVGQMLDYAANAVAYWPVEKIKADFEATCTKSGRDSETAVQEHLGTVEADPEAFWQQVKTNLQAGRVRLLFVADVIPPELARIVEFLNKQMDPAEVLALEMRQYVGTQARTLVPRIIGRTAESEQRKGPMGAGKQWDETLFFEDIGRRCPGQTGTARALLDWATGQGLRIWWGKGKVYGSFFPMLDIDGDPHWTVSVWSYGTVEIQFGQMLLKPPFSDESLRRELLKQLRACEINGADFADDCIARRPSVKLSALADSSVLARFLQVLEWYIGTVRSGLLSPTPPNEGTTPPAA